MGTLGRGNTGNRGNTRNRENWGNRGNRENNGNRGNGGALATEKHREQGEQKEHTAVEKENKSIFRVTCLFSIFVSLK